MTLPNYTVTDTNHNELEIYADGTFAYHNREAGVATKYLFSDEEEIERLHNWTAMVIEHRKNPTTVKRNAVAQRLHYDNYDDLGPTDQQAIDDLIEMIEKS